MSSTTTPTSEIDAAIDDLRGHAGAWVALPIPAKLALLDECRRLIAEHAEEWVAAAVAGKQIPTGTPLVGEEWISGPYPTLTWIHGATDTLSAVHEGRDPLAKVKVRTRPDGQVLAKVFPTSLTDALLLNGYRVDVWMDPELGAGELAATVADAHRETDRDGAVGVVLGAGNITSIPALDLLYKLYAELEVVALKFNPINEYLHDVYAVCFAPLIDGGYLRLVRGGADVGAHLTQHDGVDSIHMTGSGATHDVIVFGPGQEGRDRKARNEPVLDKRITSELGGVGPTIVVPGPWDDADLAYQAEHIATQKLHNSGFNCIASQVLVMPEGWDRADALLAEVRRTLSTVQDRPAYYPGVEQRQTGATEAHDAEELGVAGRRALITGLDATADEYAFSTEFFAPVLATTTLPGADAATFLRAAVEFANTKLEGTLGANIIIHPTTAKQLGPVLEQAIADLNYGSIGVNAWTGVAYLVTAATWGGAPGATLDDVQSGIGVVHNSRLFGRPQKSVAWAPFRPFPRNLVHGEWHMAPKPPWFVTNRTADTTAKRLTYFAADGKLSRLPGIFASALRG